MYIIGDVHGCYDTAMRLISKLPDHEKHGICFAGDLVDRGPKSSQMIQEIIDNKWYAIKGNHDDMFLKAMREDTSWKETWLDKRNGGQETLNSYDSEEQMNQHLDFIKNLPIFLEFPDLKNQDGRYLLVSHSTISSQFRIRNKLKNKYETDYFEKRVMWGDQYRIDNIPEIYNVTGHWFKGKGYKKMPRFHNPYEPTIKKIYAMIDTGGGYNDGYITAIKFPEMQIYREKVSEQM